MEDDENPSPTQMREARNYGVRFIRSGGFVHLYKILMRADINKFGRDDLSKECLVYLLRLFNHFYKQGLDNGGDLAARIQEQMQDAGLDPNFSVLVPRMLLVISTISRACTTSPAAAGNASSSKAAARRRRRRASKKTSPIPLAGAAVVVDNAYAGGSVPVANAAVTTATSMSAAASSEARAVLVQSSGSGARVGDEEISIEAEAVENATGLLVSIVSRQPTLLNTVYQVKETVQDAILFAVLECSDTAVRSEICRGINKICAASAGDDTPNAFMLTILLGEGLQSLTSNGSSTPAARRRARRLSSQSRQYFRLVETLLKQSASLPGMDTADLAKNICTTVRQCPIVQRTERDEDPRLEGLLTCLSAILARDGSPVGSLLKAAVGVEQGLVEFLLGRGLFDAPAAGAPKASLQPPLCKSASLREKAFQLLLELCRSCDANVARVAELCAPRHQFGDKDLVAESRSRAGAASGSSVATSGTSTAVSYGSKTAYFDYNGAKSATGYVGLKNMCCTCYMNSTMQNLFMMKPWRKAVLNVDVDLGDPTESIIYQTQRMYAYLQESEKQFYNPKGFCHTYKDPEDATKPIDVRVQQDASGFYGRVLQTFKDQLVNTRHENILDVFNIMLCRQKFATGSDGHKYTSSRNEPAQQYLSLDIRGIKNLEMSVATAFASTDLDGFKWDKHDGDGKEELKTVMRDSIKRLPPCLTLHLKRFALNYETFMTVKVNDRFEFPLEINMFPYSVEGRAYWDARGGAPVVVASAYNQSAGQSAGAGDNGGGVGGKTADGTADGGGAGGKTADADGETPRSSSNLPPGGAADTGEDMSMFVPADAPHPPEYYLYDLVGMTIQEGTADSGHYFSYIRERAGDNPENAAADDWREVEGKLGAAASPAKKTYKWCEFNDRVVKPWSLDNLERDCFGGEQVSTFTNAYTGKTTTTKQLRRRNAFMLFFERRSAPPVAESAGDTTAVHSPTVMRAASKMLEAAEEHKKSMEEVGRTATMSMPPELYEEIWGQNKVSWKKRNLMDPAYQAFMQAFSRLNVQDPVVRGDQLQFSTKYMLSTLVHSTAKDNVIHDWREALAEKFCEAPQAARWFLSEAVLNPNNDTLLQSMTTGGKYDKAAMSTRVLAGQALAAAAKADAANGDAAEGPSVSHTFVQKLSGLMCADPSAAWVYDMLCNYTESSPAAMGFALGSLGLLPKVLRLLLNIDETASAAMAEALGEITASKHEGKSGVPTRKLMVTASPAALRLASLLLMASLNVDASANSPHQQEPRQPLDDASKRYVCSGGFTLKLVDIASKRNSKSDRPDPYADIAQQLMLHLMWESQAFTHALHDALNEKFSECNHPDVIGIFRFVRAVLSCADSLAAARLEAFLDISLRAVQTLMEVCFKEAVFGIQHYVALAANEPRVLAWVIKRHQQDMHLEKMQQWLQDEPMVKGQQLQFLWNQPQALYVEHDDDPWHVQLRAAVADLMNGMAPVCAPRTAEEALQRSAEAPRDTYWPGYDPDGGDNPESLLTKRIRIYWHKPCQAYDGTITKYNARDGTHQGTCAVVLSSLSFPSCFLLARCLHPLVLLSLTHTIAPCIHTSNGITHIQSSTTTVTKRTTPSRSSVGGFCCRPSTGLLRSEEAL